MKKIIFVILLCAVLLLGPFTSRCTAEEPPAKQDNQALPGIQEIRSYEEKPTDKNKANIASNQTIHRFLIETYAHGHTISLHSETDGRYFVQTYTVDNELACSSWTFDYPIQKTKVSARREGNRIFLSGIHKGKKISKTFSISDLPWNQAFNLGLERFAVSPAADMKFWAIGTSGPGDMKITKFAVKKKKNETVTLVSSANKLQAKEIPAVHIQISLTGLLSMFWTGNYWYAQDDGCFLRYFGKDGPGTGNKIIELVEREKK